MIEISVLHTNVFFRRFRFKNIINKKSVKDKTVSKPNNYFILEKKIEL